MVLGDDKSKPANVTAAAAAATRAPKVPRYPCSCVPYCWQRQLYCIKSAWLERSQCVNARIAQESGGECGGHTLHHSGAGKSCLARVFACCPAHVHTAHGRWISGGKQYLLMYDKPGC